MKYWLATIIISLSISFTSCGQTQNTSPVSLIVLGTVQDGGSPHIGCKRDCCKALFANPDKTRQVVSLGVVDHENKRSFMFEATPDMTAQMKALRNFSGLNKETPDGIFLTHAHIGHYTGLMYLGREALGGNHVPVYAMPKMKSFLETNGPWSQLVTLGNIDIKAMEHQNQIPITSNLTVIPFKVPHRDEFSETVGFKILGPNKSVLFIPDIDKWAKWETSIRSEIKKVDYAFLDASFFDAEEINNRDIAEIPHPFVIESMELFKSLSKADKAKIHFIHFNHTNPLLLNDSEASRTVLSEGYHISKFQQVIGL